LSALPSICSFYVDPPPPPSIYTLSLHDALPILAEHAIVAAVSPIAALLSVGVLFFPTRPTGNTCSLVDPIGTPPQIPIEAAAKLDRKSTRLNSSHEWISYAVFCLKKKKLSSNTV